MRYVTSYDDNLIRRVEGWVEQLIKIRRQLDAGYRHRRGFGPIFHANRRIEARVLVDRLTLEVRQAFCSECWHAINNGTTPKDCRSCRAAELLYSADSCQIDLERQQEVGLAVARLAFLPRADDRQLCSILAVTFEVIHLTERIGSWPLRTEQKAGEMLDEVDAAFPDLGGLSGLLAATKAVLEGDPDRAADIVTQWDDRVSELLREREEAESRKQDQRPTCPMDDELPDDEDRDRVLELAELDRLAEVRAAAESTHGGSGGTVPQIDLTADQPGKSKRKTALKDRRPDMLAEATKLKVSGTLSYRKLAEVMGVSKSRVHQVVKEDDRLRAVFDAKLEARSQHDSEEMQ